MSRSSLALMQLLFWLSYLHHFRSSSAASCGDDDGDEHGLDDYDGDDGGSLHLMLFLTLGMSTVVDVFLTVCCHRQCCPDDHAACPEAPSTTAGIQDPSIPKAPRDSKT